MEHKHQLPTGRVNALSALAKDPVCGMSVDPATAKHKAEHGGATYYFCSAGCRDKFVAEPARLPGGLSWDAAANPRALGRDLHLPDASANPAGRSRAIARSAA